MQGIFSGICCFTKYVLQIKAGFPLLESFPGPGKFYELHIYFESLRIALGNISFQKFQIKIEHF